MIVIKICIYTIGCNEGRNVKKWVNNCKDADMIIVGLDKKSTDDTEFQLRGLGVKTIPIDLPVWDFSKARNQVLDAIPADVHIAISLDLDERLSPGWREVVEKEWEDGLGILHYGYIYLWKDDAQTIPSLTSLGYKCHDRHKYKWVNAVHENLKFLGNPEDEKKKITNNFIVEHHPDMKKERKYNEILDRVIAEEPDNAWMIHVRAREMFTHKRPEECIVDALRYLDLTKSYGTVEIGQIRAEMCRLIGRSKYSLGVYEQGELQLWMLRSVSEAPNQRENWVYLAESWVMMENWASAFGAFANAISITDRGNSPECEERTWDNNYIQGMINECIKKMNLVENKKI